MGNSGLASFAESWKPLGKEYDELKKLCGGIASAMRTTGTVEGDLSLINWTKDPFSRKLKDFSLDAIFCIANNTTSCKTSFSTDRWKVG
jgi:hypothetical protein